MPNDDLVGRVLDQGVTLVELLGREGLGHLYLARDADGVPCRVKVLAKSATAARRRFARELEAARAIRHPHVLRLLHDGEIDGVPYIVFEHVDGISLAERLDAGGPVPLDTATEMVRQVVAALKAAHDRDVVHRNLTPDNILVVRDGPNPVIRVRDFGLARLLKGDAEERDKPLTAANVRVGRLTYMAPEYISSGEATPAVDMYAVGILLFELVTGTTPPVASYPVPLPSSVVPEVPVFVDEAVYRLTDPDPASRPSVDEVARLLQPERSVVPVLAAVAVAGVALAGLALVTAGLLLWWFTT